jgi:hypothetical protein
MNMSEEDQEWMIRCKVNPKRYVINVDTHCAFVVDTNTYDVVHDFEKSGWELAIDLFNYIGCSAGIA